MTTPDEARKLADEVQSAFTSVLLRGGEKQPVYTRDVADAIRSLADQVEALTMWRPIETTVNMPFPSGKVLVGWPGIVNMGRCVDPSHSPRGTWKLVNQSQCCVHAPTHWLPLPPPPKEGER